MAMELKHLTTQMHDLSTKAVGVACDAVDEIRRLRAENAELKAKLEQEKESRYAESVDAGMRDRRLRRALYKACANWALSTLAWLDCIDQGEPRKWSEMVQKCRAKMEEYR